MTDIIEAIDHAIGCHRCGGPTGNSPSDLFCSDWCQQEWYEARTVPLDGYTEPYDLPQHVGNLLELHSPEVTPEPEGWPHVGWLSPILTELWAQRAQRAMLGDLANFAPRGLRGNLGEATYTVTVDTDGFERSLAAASRAMRGFTAAASAATSVMQGFSAMWTVIDEVHTFHVEPESVTLDRNRFSPATFDLAHHELPKRQTPQRVAVEVVESIRKAACDAERPHPPEVGPTMPAVAPIPDRPRPRRRAPRVIAPRRSR